MDARKYLSVTFITLANFEGPRRVVIEKVEEGKFDKPNLFFDDHTAMGINVTNLRVMGAAYGWEMDAWPGLTVELYLGDTEYQDKTQPSVLIKPISPRPAAAEKSATPTKTAGDDMADEIPF